MQMAPMLAVVFLLGPAGLTASATPVPVQPAPVARYLTTSVEWHPRTRHWDHHFHAHQESLRDHRPTEAERRFNRMLHGGDRHARTEEPFAFR